MQPALSRCSLSRVIQPTTGWGYTFFSTIAVKKLVGFSKQHCLDAVYLGLYNRLQVGVTPFCRLPRVIQPTTGWGYTLFRTVAAKKLVGFCKQHCLDAVYLGLYNRLQVGVTPFCRLPRVIQPTTGWGYTLFRTVAAKKLVGFCKQHSLDAVYLGLYNRLQVGVTPFCRLPSVIQPTTGWG